VSKRKSRLPDPRDRRLLDYKMAGMDGLGLCRRLRDSQPTVVVALVTAFASAATTSTAFEAGVRRVLSKPVDFAVLMPLLEEAVASG
jgi:two-component system, response regulator, stage 0 sporulation protein F